MNHREKIDLNVDIHQNILFAISIVGAELLESTQFATGSIGGSVTAEFKSRGLSIESVDIQVCVMTLYFVHYQMGGPFTLHFRQQNNLFDRAH